MIPDPIRPVSDFIVYSLLSLESGTQLADTLDFFIYDSVKIIFLLFAMIFVMAFIRTYISRKRITNALSCKRYGLGNIAASGFGAITPFCSCSSIPIFVGFLEAGVPLGVSLSFLITSPLVNEYVAVLMLGFFGPEVAIVYVIVGMLAGSIGGIFLGGMGLDKYVEKDIVDTKSKENKYKSLKQRADFSFKEAKTILGKLWLWIFVGVGLGAVIHGYIPDELIDSIVTSAGIFAVPIAVLIGIPIYANCSAVVPIAAALFQKGAPLGTALAFMMATAALSLPEAIILRRAMKLKLLALFFGSVALGIIIIGLLFNILF
jgi:uncharacterized membrane protein YraQ (UPF0718 family)